MATLQEQLLKAEHDAYNARATANAAQARIDYNIMMGLLEDPTEDEEEEGE